MRVTVFALYSLVLALVIGSAFFSSAFRPESPPASKPICTDTTIDKYFPCAPAAPIMLRKR